MRKSVTEIRDSFVPAFRGMCMLILAVCCFIVLLWVIMALVRTFMALGS